MNLNREYRKHYNELIDEGYDPDEAKDMADEALGCYVDMQIDEMKNSQNLQK